MDTWQSPPITIERNSSVVAKLRASSEGVALIYGNEVWVNNLLVTPDEAVAIGQGFIEAAIHARSMGAS